MYQLHFDGPELTHLWQVSHLRGEPTNRELCCKHCQTVLTFNTGKPIQRDAKGIHFALYCKSCDLEYRDALAVDPKALHHQILAMPLTTHRRNRRALAKLPSEPFNAHQVTALTETEDGYMAPYDWFLWARYIYSGQKALRPIIQTAMRCAIDQLSRNAVLHQVGEPLLKGMRMHSLEQTTRWASNAAVFLLPRKALELHGHEIRFISYAYIEAGAYRFKTVAGVHTNTTDQLVAWYGNPSKGRCWFLVRNLGSNMAQLQTHPKVDSKLSHDVKAYYHVQRLIMALNQFIVDSARERPITRHQGDVPPPQPLTLLRAHTPPPELPPGSKVPWRANLGLLKILEDQNSYTPFQVAKCIWDKGLVPLPDTQQRAWIHNAGRALTRLAKACHFPKAGDVIKKSSCNKPIRTWYGHRWKTCIKYK